MTTKLIFATACAAIFTMTVFSCSEARRDEISSNFETAGKDIDTTMQQTRESFIKEKEAFREKINMQMEKNRQDITELKAKAKTKKENARKKYDEDIARLEQKNEELKTKLSDYNYESKEKWENFKEEFSQNMDTLGNSISDFFHDHVKDKK